MLHVNDIALFVRATESDAAAVYNIHVRYDGITQSPQRQRCINTMLRRGRYSLSQLNIHCLLPAAAAGRPITDARS